MSFEDGALLEPLSVALAGIERAQLRLGQAVIICGAGPIGLVTLLCARAAGAEPVLITDIDAGRLAFAKQLVEGHPGTLHTLLVERSKSVDELGSAIASSMASITFASMKTSNTATRS